MKKTLLVMLSFVSLSVFAETDFIKILKNVDDIQNFTTDLSATVTLASKKIDKDLDISKLRFNRRDKDDKIVYVFLEPLVRKGTGFLKVEDDLWSYDPNQNEFTHSSLKASVGGSNARNGDFGKSTLAIDYNVVKSEEGVIAKQNCYVLTLLAKNDLVETYKLKIWITKDGANLPLKQEDYSRSDRLMRVSLYADYANISGKYIARKMRFEDKVLEGEYTQIALQDISLSPLPNDLFTKTYLQKISQ